MECCWNGCNKEEAPDGKFGAYCSKECREKALKKMERQIEQKAKDLKVGQEFVRLYPISMWFEGTAFVNISYNEYKITKLNDSSVRVSERLEDGTWLGDTNWKFNDNFNYDSKSEVITHIIKNTKNILESYDRGIAKYTEVAFQHWYLKAQKRMVEIIHGLVLKNELNFKGLKLVEPLIKRENKILEAKLKLYEGD